MNFQSVHYYFGNCGKINTYIFCERIEVCFVRIKEKSGTKGGLLCAAAAAASLSTEISGAIPSIPKKEAVLQKMQEAY